MRLWAEHFLSKCSDGVEFRAKAPLQLGYMSENGGSFGPNHRSGQGTQSSPIEDSGQGIEALEGVLVIVARRSM